MFRRARWKPMLNHACSVYKKSPAEKSAGRAYVPVHSTGVVQLTRFQVWPPQNMPPKAQPCTRSEFVPFIAIVES